MGQGSAQPFGGGTGFECACFAQHQEEFVTTVAAENIFGSQPRPEALCHVAKHHVANMLWKITDRAIQVHGALGYSTDTPLERMLRHARSARLVDGADEVHLSQIAANVMAAVREDGTSRRATGLDLL